MDATKRWKRRHTIIYVSREAWKRLQSLKEPGESNEDVLLRLLGWDDL